ncbi:GNAT family N-acetyltransferase [Streptomyces sp. NPDC048361]|uniref:GNAT family N-acetyltransferase n=1 Tax=Streptomyces sp. NPDC048361 TaxID=3154720 RepID=UPI0034430428
MAVIEPGAAEREWLAATEAGAARREWLAATEPSAGGREWLAALPGFQSHHRSVLTWPALIEGAGTELADAVLHSGARVLAFGVPFPDTLVGDVAHETVTVWTVDPDGRTPAASATPTPEQWSQMVELWRATGITVLAGSARDHPSWTHALCFNPLDPPGHVVATASTQQLPHPITELGARILMCAVATSPDHRKKGAAAQCVRALTAGRRAAALVEAGSQSARFFQHLGWRPDSVAHLYRYGA